MSEVERMTVAFPESVAARLHAAVKSGEYETAADAVRDAVDQWAERQSLGAREIDLLRRAWDEGVASGACEPLDMTAILTEARAIPPSGPRG